jgi:uncharacterized MAPEG superfamily protein
MTPDLTYLTYSAILAIVQVFIFSATALRVVSLNTAVGNREDIKGDLPGMAGRAARAHRNMIENLAPFAVLVLVAHVAGKANELTALGAMIFFYARVAFAVLYVAGVPWLRSLAYAAGIVGMIIIAIQLV